MNGISVGGRANDPANNYVRYIGNTNPVTRQAEVGYKARFSGEVDAFAVGTVISRFLLSGAGSAPLNL